MIQLSAEVVYSLVGFLAGVVVGYAALSLRGRTTATATSTAPTPSVQQSNNTTESQQQKTKAQQSSSADEEPVPDGPSDYKMMTTGKKCAQCGHAALAAFRKAVKLNEKWVNEWFRTGQTKIALKVTSEEQLLKLQQDAKQLSLPCAVIQDAGRTQVEPGSRTVLAIGPAPVSLVDRVSKELKLL